MNFKKNIPNICTVLNLLCGCVAITKAISYELVFAAYWIIAAAIFDFLDGFLARLFNAYSDLGKQLDSFADMVSFALAPSLILYQLIRYPQGTNYTVGEYTQTLAICHLLSYIAFMIAVFSAIRLGRFNLGNNETNSFTGLPTPACALLLISIPLFTEKNLFELNNIILNPYILTGLTIVLSYLLISKITLFSLKFKDFQWKDNEIRYIFLGLSVILFIYFYLPGLTMVILLYIILSFIKKPVKENTNIADFNEAK